MEIPGSPPLTRQRAGVGCMAARVVTLAPSGQATEGLVGATRASILNPKTASKSPLMSVRTFWALT